MTDFGAILAALLDETEVSHMELGRRLGHKDPGRQVRRWINSPTTPRWETVIVIAGALGVEPSRMLAPAEDQEASAATSPSAAVDHTGLLERRRRPRSAGGSGGS